MPTAFPPFQPLALRHKTLANRIVGAHTANMSEGGLRASATAPITRSAPSAAPP